MHTTNSNSIFNVTNKKTKTYAYPNSQTLPNRKLV